MPSQQNKPNNHSEHADPFEQHNPIPKIVLALVMALVLWAVCYIFVQELGGDVELGDRRDPIALAGGAAAGSGSVDGAQVFAANCQACHQVTGKGLPGVFPPLANSSWVTGDPIVAAQILLHGMTGKIEVAGVTYEGAMPAFAQQLKDEELAAVLSHIRSQWGNAASAVSTAQITAARTASAERKQAWHGTQELLDFVATKPE